MHEGFPFFFFLPARMTVYQVHVLSAESRRRHCVFSMEVRKGLQTLELQIVASCHMGAKNWTQVLQKNSQCLQLLSHLSSSYSFKSLMSSTFCDLLVCPKLFNVPTSFSFVSGLFSFSTLLTFPLLLPVSCCAFMASFSYKSLKFLKLHESKIEEQFLLKH